MELLASSRAPTRSDPYHSFHHWFRANWCRGPDFCRMLSAGHAEPIASGNTPENADDLPSNINHRRKPRRASRLRHEPAPASGNQEELATQKSRAPAGRSPCGSSSTMRMPSPPCSPASGQPMWRGAGTNRASRHGSIGPSRALDRAAARRVRAAGIRGRAVIAAATPPARCAAAAGAAAAPACSPPRSPRARAGCRSPPRWD